MSVWVTGEFGIVRRMRMDFCAKEKMSVACTFQHIHKYTWSALRSNVKRLKGINLILMRGNMMRDLHNGNTVKGMSK